MTQTDITLTTFTDKEVDLTEHALGIAASHLRAMAENEVTMPMRAYTQHYREGLLQLAQEMAELLLKIQANR